MARSELLQRILMQNLAGSAQNATTAPAAIGSILQALILGKAMQGQQSKDYAESANLATALSQQNTPPNPVTIAGVGGIPDMTSSVNAQPVSSLRDQLMNVSGGQPEPLRQMLMQQMMGPQGDGYALSPGQTRFDAANRPIASLPANDKTSTPAKIQELETIWGPKESWTPEQKQQALDSFLKAGTGTTVNINPEKPLASDLPSLRDLAGVQVNTKNLLSMTGRMREQLAADPAMGLAGVLVRGGNVIAEQAKQFGKIAGGSDYKDVSNPALYKDVFDQFSWLDADARKSAAVQSNIIRLAYMQAKAYDSQGRVAKDDMKNAMATLAASGGSPTQMLATLDEVDSFARINAGHQYEAFKGESMPPDWLGDKAPEPNAQVPGGKGPSIGTVDGDYVFMGGDPADPKSWKPK